MPRGGGGGGAGGYGALVNGSSATNESGATIAGGNGGSGGNGLSGNTTTTVTATSAQGGSGGAGGIGVYFVNSGATLTNAGSIRGGNGGTGGTGQTNGVNDPTQAGGVGAGGVGVSGSGLSITNSGTIAGGVSGSGAQANAVTFTGGTNNFTITSTSTVTGNVVASSTADTFGLGGSTNSTFNLGQLGAANSATQYQGFGTLQKSGASTWSVTGTPGTSLGYQVQAGTLDLNGGTQSATSLQTTGGTLTNGSLTLSGGFDAQSGTISAGLSSTGALTKSTTGTVTLTGNNTFTGTTLNGGTLVDAPATPGTSSIGSGPVTFAGSASTPATLALSPSAQPASGGTFGNTLVNFTGSNSLDLRNFAFNGVTSYNATNSMLTIRGGGNGGTQSETFNLQNGAVTYYASDDGNGGTVITAQQITNGGSSTTGSIGAPCYVTRTRIRILRGLTICDVPIEHLRVGDLTITSSGKPRPIRWIGTRSYLGLTAPKHDRPVRIRAGALAEGMPARDLLVSPDHCLWLDGLLVAAGHLVNGTSITRGEAMADLTYWHVELDTHDLLLAENTPAESFLAAPGVRAGFDGVNPGDAAIAPVPYAVRAERDDPAVVALRERLILRAGLSIAPTCFGAVQAWLDVCEVGESGALRVAGWARDVGHSDAPVCLDILLDNAVVALALAQDYRADLAAAGLGDGCHGFDIALDEPLTPGVPHTVEVRRSADGLRVCAMAADVAGAWTALLAA